ncbi:MAG: hypothetical protein ACSLE6_11825 [Mycobacterium sp.]
MPEEQTGPQHTGHHVPSWLRTGNPESNLPVVLALIAAMALQLVIPGRYRLVPSWPLVTMEALLLVTLVVINPLTMSRRTRYGKVAIRILLGAITIDNTGSAVRLAYQILTGQVSNDPAILFGSGTAIFVTNIIAFGIWYWELDSGGPIARCNVEQRHPDFMFPQMGNPELAPPHWRPLFLDYLYVSTTNVTAFSPTDTMPLTRWAKAMMTVQAAVGLSTLVLVVSRAVNVLG